MIGNVIEFLMRIPLLLRVLIIGLIPASLTALGTAPIFLGVRLGRKSLDVGMGFASGVMLVASFTSLLIPAIERSDVKTVIIGFIIGVVTIKALDVIIPHEHGSIASGEGGLAIGLRRAQLMALAMIIHNIPEGMAVGATTIYSVADGLTIAFAIGLQDIPEGLAVAIPILMITGNIGTSFIMGALSGLAEALATMLPVLMVTYAQMTLPFVLSLASGAMIYVVIHEIIPEIYGHEYDELITLGFFAGFLTMLVLDNLIG
ncbi:MAG: ZIP family metal transporter [Thermoprotei archaeon]|nr:MAG: ZIP family metal transporter [Thermoprotei archaeon]